MATGLLALLDDVAGIARIAAASLDDVGAAAAKAGTKAAGIVIDDAAVTPRYVVGLAAERELPIIRRIAVGSLRNKFLFLLPAALALAAFAPWLITPILMAGGVYLAFEGAEKLREAIWPHAVTAVSPAPDEDPAVLEQRRVAQAIRTDMILSAEVMAITLSTVPEAGFWTRAVVLALVGFAVTVVVYGAVAIIVKADDAGVAVATRPGASAIERGLGTGLVRLMPSVMTALQVVGTAAMLWVGGGIILHGLAEYGLGAPYHALHGIGVAVGGFAGWLVEATGAGAFGLLAGIAAIGMVEAVSALRRPRAAPAA